MGPRSHERGNAKAMAEAYQAALLQWGRVLMNAETVPTPSPKPKPKPLQWGRVLMNAETSLVSNSHNGHSNASMGPRSHERGNPTVTFGIATALRSLQWGRVLMNAETRRG